MIMLHMQKHVAEIVARNSFTIAQKMRIEAERHRASLPEELQDQEYLKYLENQMEAHVNFIEEFNRATHVPAALNEGQEVCG
jgi:hypothetical protein